MTEAGNIARREQYIESALERIADLEAENNRMKTALRRISMHYGNNDMNHVDFRVFAKQTADDALDGQLTEK